MKCFCFVFGNDIIGTLLVREGDFLVNSRENYKNYGVEVKAGRSVGRTAWQLLRDGKVEAIYFLKGDTYGGITERMVTVPIYLVSRVSFDWEDNGNNNASI